MCFNHNLQAMRSEVRCVQLVIIVPLRLETTLLTNVPRGNNVLLVALLAVEDSSIAGDIFLNCF